MDVLNYDGGPYVGNISNFATLSTDHGFERFPQPAPYVYRSGHKQFNPPIGRGMLFGPKGTHGATYTSRRTIIKQHMGPGGVVDQASNATAFFLKQQKVMNLGKTDPHLPRGGSIMRIVGTEVGDVPINLGNADIISNIVKPTGGRYDNPAGEDPPAPPPYKEPPPYKGPSGDPGTPAPPAAPPAPPSCK